MGSEALSRPAAHELSVLGALRHVLERRALGEIAGVEAGALSIDATPNSPPRLWEIRSFREMEPDLLRELVLNLASALHSRHVEALLWIQGDGERLRFYLGQYDDAGAGAPHDFLRTSAEGFFKGAELSSVNKGVTQELLASLRQQSHAAVLCGIPSEREGTQVQTRLDEALEALARRRFDLLVRVSRAWHLG